MDIIDINLSNIDTEHICCAIGDDKANQSRALTKKDWLKERFKDGLVFKRLDARGKVFIEYLPAEAAWKPVVADNYFLINCLWVSGQYKGQGHAGRLLDSCLDDARKSGRAGVAVVTAAKAKPFLTDKRFFVKRGFVVADAAPPYFELLALRLPAGAPPPRFTAAVKTGAGGNGSGLTFVYSNQCVFMEEYVASMAEWARSLGFACESVKLSSAAEAQAKGSPFGTLGIYHDGKFLTHELMAEAKFRALLGTFKRA